MAGLRTHAPVGLLALALLALAAAPSAAERPELSEALRQQLRAIRVEKDARTPAEQKIDSRLLYAGRMRRGFAAAAGVPVLEVKVDEDRTGRVLVDLRAHVSAPLLQAIVAAGGQVTAVVPRFDHVRARIPFAALGLLAERADVQGLRPAEQPIRRVTTLGDVSHRSAEVRSGFPVDGSGVTVAVVSDGVDELATVQGGGELPAVSVLAGQAGSGTEGTAMLEIVHDIAPGAALIFATGLGGQAQFAQNILDLRAAGADIIVDDLAYLGEAVFTDDDIASSVDEVVADGALYFAAAGNSGNRNDGTSSAWEGDFKDSGQVAFGGNVHDWAFGVVGNEILATSPTGYTLHWSDLAGSSGNDYDLFLTDATLTTVFAASTNTQNGNDDPVEIILASANDDGRVLVAVKQSGAARMLHLQVYGGRIGNQTAGNTSGHAGARGAIGVAAVRDSAGGGPGGIYDGSELVENYSSDGPRRVHWEADGTAITPGDFSVTGGELRDKPEITGADCVATTTAGFGNFCGTSAAAPHAAAIAALLWEMGESDGQLPKDLRALLENTAIDIEDPGLDRDSGHGIAAALDAALALDASCSDGQDNDGDTEIDLLDPGCASASDRSERDPSRECDDGIDNDDDGFTDWGGDLNGDDISDPPGDPGCRDPASTSESPQCDDGIDNDGDTLIDYPADPECGLPWDNKEKPGGGGCGLGPGLLLLLPLGIRRGRRRPTLLTS